MKLITLVKTASLTELTCLEELIKRCLAFNALEGDVFTLLWKIYKNPSKTVLNVENIQDEREF